MLSSLRCLQQKRLQITLQAWWHFKALKDARRQSGIDLPSSMQKSLPIDLANDKYVIS